MGNAISYGWILDIFFLLFSVLTILVARKKGFVLSLLDFAAFFLAVFLAIPVSGWLAEGIYNTFISQSVVTALEAQLPSSASGTEIAAQAVKNRSAQQLAYELDENAIDCYSEMTQDFIRFKLQCLNEDFEKGLMP